MIDKFKTCQNCPDRSINPPCHDTCEGYLHRVEKHRQISEKQKFENDISDYRFNRMRRAEKDRKRHKRFNGRVGK